MEQQLQKLTQAILVRGKLLKQLEVQCAAIQASVEEMKPKPVTPPAQASSSTPPVQASSSRSLATSELDAPMLTGCSMNCPDDDTDSRTSAFMPDVAPGPPLIAALRDVIITSTSVLTSTPSGDAVRSIDLGDVRVPNLSSCQLSARKVFERMCGTGGISIGFSTIDQLRSDRHTVKALFGGTYSSLATKDLTDSIAVGNYTEWQLYIQTIDPDPGDRFGLDLLDVAKTWTEDIIPLQPVGRLVLNKNIDNLFAGNEPFAFCPTITVPGIHYSDDKLLQGLETLGYSTVMGITNWCKTCSYYRMILRDEHLLVVDCKYGNWIASRAVFLPPEPVSFILLEDLTLSVCYHTKEESKPWETTCPDDELQVKVNKLSSTKTQLPYDYYFLEYCKPCKIMNSAENLGEILHGDRIKNSIFVFKMRRDETCKVVCRTKFTQEGTKNFKEKIDDEYCVNMILDHLPIAAPRQRRDGSQKPSYEHGFRVDYKGNDEKYFLNNYLSFKVMYHQEPESDDAHIVGFEVIPSSVKHEYNSWDETGNKKPKEDDVQISSSSAEMPVSESHAPEMNGGDHHIAGSSFSCLVKVYDMPKSQVKLNDVAEFIAQLPYGKVPRLHCLVWRNLSSLDFLARPSVVEPSPSLLKGIRQSLLLHLTLVLGKDELAAQCLLLHLLSRLRNRVDVVTVGKLSLNFTGFNRESSFIFGNQLNTLVQRLLPYSQVIPLSIEYLNIATLQPRKENKSGRLVTGVLQLPQGTHLTFDDDDQLGVRRFRALLSPHPASDAASGERKPHTGIFNSNSLKVPGIIRSMSNREIANHIVQHMYRQMYSGKLPAADGGDGVHVRLGIEVLQVPWDPGDV